MTDIHNVITLIMNYINHCKDNMPELHSRTTDIVVYKDLMFKNQLNYSLIRKYSADRLNVLYNSYEQNTPKIY